jgi:nitrilase
MTKEFAYFPTHHGHEIALPISICGGIERQPGGETRKEYVALQHTSKEKSTETAPQAAISAAAKEDEGVDLNESIKTNQAVESSSAATDAIEAPAHPHAPRRRRRTISIGDGMEIALPASCPSPVPEAISEEARIQTMFSQYGIGPDLGASAIPPTASMPVPTSEKATRFSSRGGSTIVSPFGDVLAGPQWEDDQGMIVADVDFEDCIRGRLDLDLGGSYSRNDSFKLSVAGLNMGALSY